MSTRLICFGAAMAAVTLAGAAPAFAADPGASRCFRSSQFQGFKAAGDRAMIVRAGVSDYYRVEFAHACRQITYPGALLITHTRGSDMICDGIDWDLKVGENGNPGFSVGCIVSGQRKLTKEEVAALPKGQKP
jgi:hypothetical protein